MINCKFNKIILINNLMIHGNKWKSELNLLKNLKFINKKKKKDLKKLIKLSIINSSPFFLLKKKKKRIREFPFILHNKQKYGIKKISKVSKILAAEFLNSANNIGKLVEKKKELYNNVFVNKKFAHYRWFF